MLGRVVMPGRSPLQRRVCLHAAVIGPAAALWGNPDDVLRGVLDVAGLAMHAVLRVDLQAVAVVGVFDKFVDTGRAVAAFRAGVPRQVDVDRNAGILQRQVGRLLFFVVGVG